MTLERILLRVKAGWPWTDANYPGYGALPEGRMRELFRLKHVLLHLTKQVGAVAAAIERAEHRPGDRGPEHAKRVETCGKLIASALKLADASGVDAGELEKWLSKNFPLPKDLDDEIS